MRHPRNCGAAGEGVEFDDVSPAWRRMRTLLGMELREKRVLITGASRGIGESLARAFADAGANVALVARSQDSLRAVASATGGTVHAADLADADQVSGLIDRVESEAGRVDVLINNAGIESSAGFADAPADELRRVTEVNYLAPAELCRQVIPRMLRRGGGHIVNVSSMAGIVVFPGLVTYSASKAALSHFTAGLRADLRGLPIGTTLVQLGPVPTELLARADNYEPTAASFRRFARAGVAVETPRETVARHVVEAVRKDRRHVRLPGRAAPFALLVEAPRRITEVLLTGVPHQQRP